MDAAWASSIEAMLNPDINQNELLIGHRLRLLKEEISNVARSAGRCAEEVTLIAVSKTKPLPDVKEAILAGQIHFGENTVQDAMTKIPQLRDHPLDWHFIGHLQSKKAQDIPGHFSWVHSVDSIKLASKLSQAAVQANCSINILIQVNVSGEITKSGLAPDQLNVFIESLLYAKLPALNLRGLMTIGPHQANEQGVRQVFARLRQLRDDCAQRFGLTRFSELSMGMSQDYVPAIKEGATMIRLGTSVFGARSYPPKTAQ